MINLSRAKPRTSGYSSLIKWPKIGLFHYFIPKNHSNSYILPHASWVSVPPIWLDPTTGTLTATPCRSWSSATCQSCSTWSLTCSCFCETAWWLQMDKKNTRNETSYLLFSKSTFSLATKAMPLDAFSPKCDHQPNEETLKTSTGARQVGVVEHTSTVGRPLNGQCCEWEAARVRFKAQGQTRTNRCKQLEIIGWIGKILMLIFLGGRRGWKKGEIIFMIINNYFFSNKF